MNLYIEGAKVLNAVKLKKSSVKTLVYSSEYDVIIFLGTCSNTWALLKPLVKNVTVTD